MVFLSVFGDLNQKWCFEKLMLSRASESGLSQVLHFDSRLCWFTVSNHSSVCSSQEGRQLTRGSLSLLLFLALSEIRICSTKVKRAEAGSFLFVCLLVYTVKC